MSSLKERTGVVFSRLKPVATSLLQALRDFEQSSSSTNAPLLEVNVATAIDGLRLVLLDCDPIGLVACIDYILVPLTFALVPPQWASPTSHYQKDRADRNF